MTLLVLVCSCAHDCPKRLQHQSRKHSEDQFVLPKVNKIAAKMNLLGDLQYHQS